MPGSYPFLYESTIGGCALNRRLFDQSGALIPKVPKAATMKVKVTSAQLDVNYGSINFFEAQSAIGEQSPHGWVDLTA
jgi:hypothetical protein